MTNGCLFRHPPAAFTPPPARVQPPLPPAQPPLLPAPPQVAADTTINLPPEIPASIPELAPPPQPRPQQKKSAATPPPKPATPAPTEQAAPPPRLVQLFTPEQEREYNHNIDDSLERVRRAVAILARKSLNPDQTEAVNRITAFQKQAEQARENHDLAGADLLAKRAATLAEDLLTRVP